MNQGVGTDRYYSNKEMRLEQHNLEIVTFYKEGRHFDVYFSKAQQARSGFNSEREKNKLALDAEMAWEFFFIKQGRWQI